MSTRPRYADGVSSGAVAFVVLAINPIGGLMVAIPFAVLKLHWAAWLAIVTGVPLGYVQVLVVDGGWSLLCRLSWWQGFVERRRSPRIERLTASRGSFWLTVLLAPLVGPWLVMALLRYAQVPQRRVALPILLGLLWNGSALAACSVLLPRAFQACAERNQKRPPSGVSPAVFPS